MPSFPPTGSPMRADAAATGELLGYTPQLSVAERDRRWDRLRKKMLMAGLEALVFLGNDIYWGMGMANMRYVFQVDSQIGADGLFCLEGEPVVWNAPPHMNRPSSLYHSLQTWVSDIRPRGGIAAAADEIRQRGLGGARLGLVGFSSTIQTTSTILHEDKVTLERLLPDVTWTNASSLLQEMRMIKSEEEIGMLRQAGRIARLTLDALVDTARPGVTDAAVYAEMVRTQIANGAEPNIFNLFAAGPVEHPPEQLWHLLHGAEQPLTPSMRPLREGDVIVTEWHTKYGGYRCHTEYTVYVGDRAPKELLHLWDVAWECLDASKSALATGRTLREAWQMVREPARRAGLDWVELGFHAMGTASPEFPTVVYAEGYGSPTLNGDGIGELVLEEGMTFGNNIDLHDSRWKPDVGCMLSDFMVVRPGQAECLIGTPRELAQVN
ncbi:MAG: aminopeptidase P family protein [Actinobacteria bacterium]|nr:aminopeptidase P family protein [Actinomycetota bacterium]